jgi:hypothetical protein
MSKIAGLCVVFGAGWLCVAACGSDASDKPSTSFGGGGGTGGVVGLDTGLGGTPIDAPIGDTVQLDSGCGLISEKAKSTPLHLYIVMDKSSSMVGNKWDSAKVGLEAFVNSADSNGIYVGMKFFPRTPDAVPACDQQAYATPDTPFDLLPANAQPIIQALAAQSPNGLGTPTYPALGGGLLKGIEIAQNNPGHTSAVLLVTDGVPQGPAALCGGVNPEDTQVIADLAANGKNFNPPVLTYVIGLPGVDQSFANAVASAGGTDAAILISATNVQKEFEDALAKVRGQALPCEFDIPDEVGKGEIDFDHVNVLITPGGGSAETVPQTTDCGAGAGWYYSPAPPADPQTIVLCPEVCDGLKQDFEASVDIVLGCVTVKIR